MSRLPPTTIGTVSIARAPEATRETITMRENDFIAVADRLDAEAKREDDGYAADIATLARALARESRDARDEL